MMLFVGTDTDVPLHSDGFAAGDEDVARIARSLLAGYLAAGDHLVSAEATTA